MIVMPKRRTGWTFADGGPAMVFEACWPRPVAPRFGCDAAGQRQVFAAQTPLRSWRSRP